MKKKLSKKHRAALMKGLRDYWRKAKKAGIRKLSERELGMETKKTSKPEKGPKKTSKRKKPSKARIQKMLAGRQAYLESKRLGLPYIKVTKTPVSLSVAQLARMAEGVERFRKTKPSARKKASKRPQFVSIATSLGSPVIRKTKKKTRKTTPREVTLRELKAKPKKKVGRKVGKKVGRKVSKKGLVRWQCEGRRRSGCGGGAKVVYVVG